MPPAAPSSRTPQLRAGGGSNGVGQHYGNARGGDDLGAGTGECLGAEAGVVTDAEALGGVFLGVHVGGNGLGGDAHIGKGEIVGDDRAPAVGTEFDLRMRHV